MPMQISVTFGVFHFMAVSSNLRQLPAKCLHIPASGATTPWCDTELRAGKARLRWLFKLANQFHLAHSHWADAAEA